MIPTNTDLWMVRDGADVFIWPGERQRPTFRVERGWYSGNNRRIWSAKAPSGKGRGAAGESLCASGLKRAGLNLRDLPNREPVKVSVKLGLVTSRS